MSRWKIDPDHASAEFTVRHMMVTPVHGQFNSVTGWVFFDPADPVTASVKVEIDAAGLYTGVERRDNHLRSPDFFDVERYPILAFTSTAVDVASLNNCKVTGDLTIHGVSRPVTFDVDFSGPSRFYDDELKQMYTTLGFRATATINREDFGMTWNVGIENRGVMVGRYVDIIFNAEVDLDEE